MSWYLQIAGGAPQLFSDLGLSRLKRTIASQKAGRFTFTAEGAAADSNALAPEGTICTVWLDSEPFFSGRLWRIPRKGSGSAESVDYELLDAWHDFEKNVYQQQWNVIQSVDEGGEPTLAAEYRSEIILGIDLNGTPMTSGQVIADIVLWAVSVGAYCQLGVIGVDAPVPLDEVTDLPCSECIKKMLRWTPDAVTSMDYSTTPPTLNIVRRGDCLAVEAPFTGNVEDIEIKALPELLAPSVVFRYLQVNQTDGTPSVNVIVDDYPEGSDGTEYGSLVQTTRLAGTDATYQRVAVTVTAIPTDDSSGDDGGPSDDPTIAWWRRKAPWLQSFSADRLSITNVQGVFDTTGTDTGTDGNPISDYPNELLTGTIAPWMNVKVAATSWSADVYYNYPDSPDDESTRALNVFGPPDGSDNASGQVYIGCQARATSAVTQTYAQLSSYVQAEPVPMGLAETLYAAVSVLQYEGSYTIIGSEVSDWTLGLVLNIAGGRTEWAAMNALLQEIEDDLENGRTTLKFGPAGHLTHQDLMEMLRANRSRTISSHIKERQSGVPGDAPIVDDATDTATGGSATMPTPGLPPWCDYINDQDAGDNNDPPATWEVLFGYGQSSFANSDEIDHAAPIEKFELSVGQDGSGWSGTDHDSTDDNWGLSIQSGNDDPEDDILFIGTSNGSVTLTPNDPSIYLGPDIDPGDDDDDTQHINISLGDMIIEMQDEDGSLINMDLSGSPVINIQNANTSNSAILDENSLTLEDSGSGGTITIDASQTGGHSLSVQTITVCVAGDSMAMMIIGSDPY
jgi:hypothetical protein